MAGCTFIYSEILLQIQTWRTRTVADFNCGANQGTMALLESVGVFQLVAQPSAQVEACSCADCAIGSFLGLWACVA